MNLNSETIRPRIDLKWEGSPHMYLLGKIPQGPPPTLQRCALVRSTRILTLDQLAAPVPWTVYCLSLIPGGCQKVDSTNYLCFFFFNSPTEESLRPDTSSYPWNQGQQPEDDFPGS